MSDLEIRSPGEETTTAWALASTENWDTTTTTAWALASTNNWATSTETPCTTTTAWALASTGNWDTTTTTAWALASTNGWGTTTGTPCTTSSWITSTTKPCTTTSTTSCTTTTSSTTTRCGLCGDSRATAAPATYTNSNGQVVAVKHDNGGLAPGIVGAIVIGVFFGILLIALLCIFCFRAARSRARYEEDDDESEDSRRRPPRPIDPYGGRPMTFVGGGSRPETKVVITRQQRMFVRPPVARTRRERVVVVEED